MASPYINDKDLLELKDIVNVLSLEQVGINLVNSQGEMKPVKLQDAFALDLNEQLFAFCNYIVKKYGK